MFAAKLKLTSPQGKTHDSKKKAFQGGSRSCRAACSGLPRPPRDIKKWIEENEKKAQLLAQRRTFFVSCFVLLQFAPLVLLLLLLVWCLSCAVLVCGGDFLMITDIKAAAAAAVMVALGNRSSEKEAEKMVQTRG